jgi:SAM-dependent methyltransferase
LQEFKKSKTITILPLLAMLLFPFRDAEALAPLCKDLLGPYVFAGVDQNIPNVEFTADGVKKWYMRSNRTYNDLILHEFKSLIWGKPNLPPKFLDPMEWGGLDVIDTGCGGGTLVESLRDYGVRAVGVDIRLDEHQKNKEYFRQADLRHTGYPDRSFDILLNSYNIFHYSETPEFYREAIREFIRVMKPGGVIFVMGAKKGIKHFLEFPEQLQVVRDLNNYSSQKIGDSSDVILQKIGD